MGYVKDELMYNMSGYDDPTAGIALKHICKEKPSGYVSWVGQPIYICPTWEIRNEEDIDRLETCCRFAERQGAQPISPLLFYAGIVDITNESEQRKVLSWSRAWIRRVSEIWVFGGKPPQYIKIDLVHAVRRGKTIRYFSPDSKGSYMLWREIACRRKRDEESSERSRG